ncbi:MAG: hypothetical protein IJ740_12630 [Ruminococcus sp.]|nr:hypothetical protein [Ruminococcus sp.]
MDFFVREKIIYTLIISIIVIAVLFIPVRLIFFRLYPGDRIEGELTLIIDGEEYPLDESDLSYEFEHKKIEGRFDDGEVSIKAGEYGQYIIRIDSLPEIPPVYVKAFQANWWNKTDFDLSVEIDTKEQIVTYRGKYSYITELGFTDSESISDTQPFTDNELAVGF